MVFNISNEILIVVIGILFLWAAVLTIITLKIWRHYNKLVIGTKGEGLAKILDKILEKVKQTEKETGKLKEGLKNIQERSRKFIQKANIMRFNPFKDVGGDQSFITALLDADKSGIVISSLHSRNATRWFAKKIKKGKGVDHKLSEEEKKLINE